MHLKQTKGIKISQPLNGKLGGSHARECCTCAAASAAWSQASEELLACMGIDSRSRGEMTPSASTAPFSATTYSPAQRTPPHQATCRPCQHPWHHPTLSYPTLTQPVAAPRLHLAHPRMLAGQNTAVSAATTLPRYRKDHSQRRVVPWLMGSTDLVSA